ncbi:MAG TPA: arginine--tRNA ligase [Firmicutes bacterium]|jgi:arginyl-tRNA synthetase|nr:arginine--tRNA ligase [Bacillota bacterium]
MQIFKEQIAQKLAPLIEWEPEQVVAALELPPDAKLGDLAFPCFQLAPKLRKAPPAIAADLAERLEAPAVVAKVQVVGGYLNFFLHPQALAEQVLDAVLEAGDAYGNTELGAGKTIVIDFSSPNIAKPFGVGHMPTTVLGNSISKLYKALGYNVVRVNHLGDWGTQFGAMMVAYLKWGDNDPLTEDPIGKLYRLYVKFHQEEEKEPALRDEARAWFNRLETGDPEAKKLWQLFYDVSLKNFKRTYNRLGIDFDYYTGESFYVDKIDAALERVKAAGITEISDGALVVPLGDDLPPCLLQKSDGATLYATRDLAALFYREETFKPERIIYVVALDQSLHFKQLKLVLEKMGLPLADALVHVPFGLVKLPEGKMSTRRGQMVLLDDVLQEATSRVQEIIAEKNPELANREQVAEEVGIGAVIFHNLKNSRMRDIIFDWNEVLNFDGETGPYLQYTHARCMSVIRKSGRQLFELPEDLSGLTDEAAQQVLKRLSQFPEAIVKAAETYEPSTMSRYLLDLAQDFNRFYNTCRIIGEETAVESSRLALVKAVAQVMRRGLYLLGLSAPEQM